MELAIEIEKFVRPVKFQKGLVEIELDGDARPDLPARLAGQLRELTSERWSVVLAKGGGPTVGEMRAMRERELHDRAAMNPIIQDIIREFPDARIVSVAASGSRVRSR